MRKDRKMAEVRWQQGRRIIFLIKSGKGLRERGMDSLREYLTSDDPEQRTRAERLRAAIGLQDVDSLTVSPFLVSLAERSIRGELCLAECRKELTAHYKEMIAGGSYDMRTADAEFAAINIAECLGDDRFSLTPAEFSSIHQRIFTGVLRHAGEFREYDITKREKVLRGDTVDYAPASDLPEALDYDMRRERKFSYEGLTSDEAIAHFSEFITGIWQIHPFPEGNTRTTAVFAVRYLRHLGFTVHSEAFAESSKYFRNALVRANYTNFRKGVDSDMSFLILFLRCLMLGEKHELRSSDLIIPA